MLNFWFSIMSGPFQRTVVLNVSEFPSSATRVDIAKCVHAKFSPHFPIDSIQFMPGANVQVTFLSSAAKRSVESVESIAIGSVHCRVVRPGPRMENVLVFHYPYESNPSALRRALSSYGEVHEISMQHYPDLNLVSTGTRIVRMVRKASIPRSLDINGVLVKVWYRGQPLECDICGKSGHVSKVCPMKGKCRRCLQPGHLARNCTNAPRAWGAVPSTVSSVASLDPTPAEAAAAAPASVPVRPADVPVSVPDVSAPSASSAPASMVIGVYGADENWGMGEGEMGVASADCNEDSATVVGADDESEGVVDGGDPEASQSILAAVAAPPSAADRPPFVVAPVAEKPKRAPVFQYTPPASLQDGQVVNTPLSFDFSLTPVTVVVDEGDAARPDPIPSPASSTASFTSNASSRDRAMRSFRHTRKVHLPETD